MVIVAAVLISLGWLPVLGQDGLEEARTLIQKGLLDQASAVLEAMPASSEPAHGGWAEILHGNIAFERGRLGEASEAYRRARALFGTAGVGSEGARVAVDNLALVHDLETRQAHLRGLRGRIAACIASVALLSGGALLLLARQASERARSPEAPRPS